MYDEGTIGARARALRKWRGMTLAQVAGLAGVSTSFLSMVERGERALDRRSHLAAIAAALQVSEIDLAGGPHLSADPVQSGPHYHVPALRVAVQTNRLGRASVDRARPLPEVVAAVRAIDPLRRADDYTRMGERLPDLIDELHFHVAVPADEVVQRVALTALVDAYHYVSIIAKNLGYADLAWGASQHGLTAAEMLDDPVIVGKAMFPVILNLPREGGWFRVLSMAERAVDALDPHVGDDKAGIEVLGMAALNAALAAASANNHAQAQVWLGEARALAARIPDEPLRAWQQFSATNVALWDIDVRVEAGESGGRILELAGKVEEAKLADLPYRRAVFLADIGRGLARDAKTRQAAAGWLLRAEQAAPQRIRNHPRVKETVAVMLGQARAASTGRELRGMAARMGIPH